MKLRILLLGGMLASLGYVVACVGDGPDGVSTTHGGREDAAVADSAAQSDAGADGPSTDAGDATVPSCDLSKPFSDIAKVPNVNGSANDWSARLTADELTMFLGNDEGVVGGNDLFVATRASRQSIFGAPTPIPGVNGVDTHEGSPSVTGDGTTLYFHSMRAGGVGGWDLYTSVRGDGGVFGEVSLVAGINSPSSDDFPYVVENGKTLYFASTRAGQSDIYRSTMGANDLFELPAPLPGPVTTSADEVAPVVSSDERTIYFARASFGPPETSEVWVASRANANDPFDAPSRVTELDAVDALNHPTWLSPDGCTLYFASNRAGSNALDIYRATKPK